MSAAALIPLGAGALLALGLVLIGTARLGDAVRARRADREQAARAARLHRARVTVQVIGAASPDELRDVRAFDPPPVPQPGRHRRRDVAGELTMTGFTRQLDAATVAADARMQAAVAAETGQLPAVAPSPTAPPEV